MTLKKRRLRLAARQTAADVVRARQELDEARRGSDYLGGQRSAVANEKHKAQRVAYSDNELKGVVVGLGASVSAFERAERAVNDERTAENRRPIKNGRIQQSIA